jgi:hypothetical protein
MADEREKVHRTLRLTTPHMHGPDVKALQHAANRLQDQYEHLLDYQVKEDGSCGEHTFGVSWHAAHILGLPDSALREIRALDKLDERSQALIRRPQDRTDEQRDRAQRRRAKMLDRLRKAGDGLEKAVDWAESREGVGEIPNGSNWGHPVQDWILYTGYSSPVFWCGCFVCYAVCSIGGAKIPSRIRLGYDGHINTDARARVNGLEAVPIDQARRGDIVTFDFNHIALARGAPSGGYISTIDGNTSPPDAADTNNGGGVYPKRRPLSQVTTVARITDW